MSYSVVIVPALVAVALAQVASVATSVYLHRGLAHRALRLHPIADVCFMTSRVWGTRSWFGSCSPSPSSSSAN